MYNVKKSLCVAISLVLNASVVPVSEAAQLTLNFVNNATPGANPLLSGMPFEPSSEFRFITPYGTGTNDGHRDVISGGESWSFSGSTLVGAVMTSVGGVTDTNVGDIDFPAPITSGLSGFPVCGVAGTCGSLHKNIDFLGSGSLSFIAPTSGSELGNAFGEAVVQKFSPGDAGNDIEIFFPVMNFQWATGNYLLGSDPIRLGQGSPDGSFTKGAGPGVLFFGEVVGAGAFKLWGQSNLDGVSSEGPVNGIVRDTFPQWELVGTYSSSAVPLPASIWLFGAGLAGLSGIGRRRRTQST